MIASPLELPWGGLSASVVSGAGLRVSAVRDGQVALRLRQGGERCRLAGRAHHTTVKHLLQASAIPPWQRARLPLIFVDDRLAVIPNVGVCAEFAARKDEMGYAITWSPD